MTQKRDVDYKKIITGLFLVAVLVQIYLTPAAVINQEVLDVEHAIETATTNANNHFEHKPDAQTIETKVFNHDEQAEEQRAPVAERATPTQSEQTHNDTQLSISTFTTDQQRKYLEATNAAANLVLNFLEHKHYGNALVVLQSYKLPTQVEHVILAMADYDNKYGDMIDNKSTKVLPDKGLVGGIIGHFVSIRKTPESKLEMNKKYDEIKSQLYMINDYFNSVQFFNQILNHD